MQAKSEVMVFPEIFGSWFVCLQKCLKVCGEFLWNRWKRLPQNEKQSTGFVVLWNLSYGRTLN